MCYKTIMLPGHVMKDTYVRLYASQSGQLYHIYVLLCYTLHKPDHGLKSFESYKATNWQFKKTSALAFNSAVAWFMSST